MAKARDCPPDPGNLHSRMARLEERVDNIGRQVGVLFDKAEHPTCPPHCQDSIGNLNTEVAVLSSQKKDASWRVNVVVGLLSGLIAGLILKYIEVKG